ncbi:hypothetical protein SATRM34S_00276 [Streptomyces atroolivaceus]
MGLVVWRQKSANSVSSSGSGRAPAGPGGDSGEVLVRRDGREKPLSVEPPGSVTGFAGLADGGVRYRWITKRQSRMRRFRERRASAGTMSCFVPAWNCPTVSTTEWAAATSRDPTVCRRVTM